jgi:ABC-type bacteriocin/lantibiotic exporter with double-glycine peptidase domain
MAKTIFTEVNEVVKQTLTPMLDLVTYSMIVVVIAIVLIIIDPKLALILLLGIGGLYGAMHFMLVRFLVKIGKQRRKANKARFLVASEIFGGIKDLKVLGREKVYLANFSKPSLTYAKHQAVAQVISQTPKFFIEVFIFGVVLVIALSSLREGSINFGQVLPILGLYSMAAIRLKPAVDRIYESLSKMSFGTASLDSVLSDLKHVQSNQSLVFANNTERLKLNNKLSLNQVCFTYAGARIALFENMNLEFKAKTCIGIVGATGSGKSTLVDIILGLHQPESGQILIDGVPLTILNLRAWQNNIGYVPQHIFLADGTISSNIAFGVSDEHVEHGAIEAASKLAMLHEFILSLPEGYQTRVGERGVRLSGGQRQRIGIARALYHNPDLLIFDEATSALDNETENEVIKAIDSISGEKTIIMVAHRLSTLDKCVQIVKLGA